MAAFGVLFERKRKSGQQGVSAKNAQPAIELLGEFDGFSGVAAGAICHWNKSKLSR